MRICKIKTQLLRVHRLPLKSCVYCCSSSIVTYPPVCRCCVKWDIVLPVLMSLKRKYLLIFILSHFICIICLFYVLCTKLTLQHCQVSCWDRTTDLSLFYSLFSLFISTSLIVWVWETSIRAYLVCFSCTLYLLIPLHILSLSSLSNHICTHTYLILCSYSNYLGFIIIYEHFCDFCFSDSHIPCI